LFAESGSAAAWPLAARAQQRAMPVIGYLNVGGAAHPDELSAFHKGLGEFGYVEGRNLAVEYGWANNDVSRLPELAADLVRRRVAVNCGIADFVRACRQCAIIPLSRTFLERSAQDLHPNVSRCRSLNGLRGDRRNRRAYYASRQGSS
jgi:hypothetical protein